MATNREWLYSLDVVDLAEWFDSEHVDNDSKPTFDVPSYGWHEGEESGEEHASMTDCDPVELMRNCGGMEHGMGSLRKALGIECVSGWQMRCLKTLADMVERDYVRREECEGLEHANKRQARKIHDVCEANSKLKAERDELEKQLDTMRDVAREFRDERDEWKDKAESALHENPYVGLVRGKQWERTEMSDYYCGRCGWKVTDHDSYCPECGGAFHKAPNKPDGKFDARKTAEMPETDTAKGDIRDFDVTNLEWYAKNDLRKLCDLGIDGNMSCDDCPNQCVETEEGTSPEECQRRLLEWLMAPHANDDSAPENDVSADDVDANDAPPKGTFQVSHDCGSTFSPPVKIQGEQDTRENLDDRWYAHGGVMQLTRENVERLRGIVMRYHNGEKQAKLMGEEYELAITDELHDSRENLEADVQDFISTSPINEYSLVQVDYWRVLEWLDRQAAIDRKERVELQERVDTLTRYIHEIKQIARKV